MLILDSILRNTPARLPNGCLKTRKTRKTRIWTLYKCLLWLANGLLLAVVKPIWLFYTALWLPKKWKKVEKVEQMDKNIAEIPENTLKTGFTALCCQ